MHAFMQAIRFVIYAGCELTDDGSFLQPLSDELRIGACMHSCRWQVVTRQFRLVLSHPTTALYILEFLSHLV
jgi:hypothetical protein